MRSWTVGRDPFCDLTIDDPSVSRRHAAIRALEGGRFEIEDLGSSNGTWVRKGRRWRRVKKKAELGPEDPLRLGRLETSAVALIGAGDRALGPPAANPTRVVEPGANSDKNSGEGGEDGRDG